MLFDFDSRVHDLGKGLMREALAGVAGEGGDDFPLDAAVSRFAAYTSSLELQKAEAIDQRGATLGPFYPPVARPEMVSDWEREFYVAAYAAGISLIPQYPIEKYVVDFLLTSVDRSLAVEVDGERYHRNWTGELCRRDQIRNQRLIELGYDVMRFWVYEVRDDMAGCLERLKHWANGRAN